MPALNDVVPDIECLATPNQQIKFSDFRGKNLVLYFYPKDNTPGCIKEGQAFRDQYADFEALNTVVLGVSRDGIKAHQNFIAKQEFPFELISDKEEVLCQEFDVIREKSMYGKTYMGIDRSTFLIDAEGKLRQEWRSVKVKGHIPEVLEAIKAL